MTLLICGHCNNKFQFNTQKGEYRYTPIVCPNCGRTFPGSKKELTGNLVGKKHVHTQYKNGDILI